MITATCHCGRVRITVPGPPAFLNQCTCSVCFKYGVAWGYFDRHATTIAVKGQPTVSAGSPAATSTVPLPGFDLYVRADNGEPRIGFHRCQHCGCMTHWSGLSPEKADVSQAGTDIGVNTRLMPQEDLAEVERRISTGPLATD